MAASMVIIMKSGRRVTWPSGQDRLGVTPWSHLMGAAGEPDPGADWTPAVIECSVLLERRLRTGLWFLPVLCPGRRLRGHPMVHCPRREPRRLERVASLEHALIDRCRQELSDQSLGAIGPMIGAPDEVRVVAWEDGLIDMPPPEDLVRALIRSFGYTSPSGERTHDEFHYQLDRDALKDLPALDECREAVARGCEAWRREILEWICPPRLPPRSPAL